MIRERYEPMSLFDLVPLAAGFEPELVQLDRLLEDDVLFAKVRDDLARRRPRSMVTGRPSTPVEVILRLLVVKRLDRGSEAETEHVVADSRVLRQFSRVYVQAVPDDTTLLRWATLIGPLARADLRDTLQGQVERSLSQGAKAATGGAPLRGRGYYYAPIVLTRLGASHPRPER